MLQIGGGHRGGEWGCGGVVGDHIFVGVVRRVVDKCCEHWGVKVC